MYPLDAIALLVNVNSFPDDAFKLVEISYLIILVFYLSEYQIEKCVYLEYFPCCAYICICLYMYMCVSIKDKRLCLVNNINCNKEQEPNIKYSMFLLLIVSFIKNKKYVIIIEFVNNYTTLHDNIYIHIYIYMYIYDAFENGQASVFIYSPNTCSLQVQYDHALSRDGDTLVF